MSDKREFTTAELTAAILRTVAKESERERRELGVDHNPVCSDCAALDWLNTHCMSADPIMGRSTYRWTIEHDEPDIRAAIAELRKANQA